MPHFKLTVAYDGGGFVGWQRQPSGISIQGLLEDALAVLDGRAVPVAGAGRTDAGTHARGQVASFTLTRAIDGTTLVRALNANLPRSVRVRDAVEVDPDFHARFSAIRKTYHYRVWNGEVVDPFERAYVWQVPAPQLDVASMARAAGLFCGTHDFAAFEAIGSEPEHTTRTMTASDVTPTSKEGGTLIVFAITGDGFLRHMVRAMIGTLVEVGRGKRSVDWVTDVLASGRRAEAGPTAPPQGLVLVSVEYEPSGGA